METNKPLSNYEILVKGQLTVNLPVIAVILFFCFSLTIYTDLGFRTSAVIGFIVGWIYWTFAVKKWIEWAAIENKVDKERLYKIGKYGLLLWNRNHIEEVVEKKGKPWF
jgi:hypothetical protein